MTFMRRHNNGIYVDGSQRSSYKSKYHPGMSLQWRHNGYDSVSNHQPHDCLLNRLFRRRSKKTPKLRVTGLCAGNSPGTVNSTHKWPVTRKTFPFDDVIMLFEERNINTTVFLISPCKFFYSLLRIVWNDFPTITLDMKWFSHYNIGYDKAPISHSVTFLSEKKKNYDC